MSRRIFHDSSRNRGFASSSATLATGASMTLTHSNGAQKWLIYGANGYTGALIAEEALRRGHRPRLGGRNREAIETLAGRLQTEAALCDLLDEPAVRAAVSGCEVVLNCAGPFSHTSRPILEACLAEAVGGAA